jgi:hypothetical protein
LIYIIFDLIFWYFSLITAHPLIKIQVHKLKYKS